MLSHQVNLIRQNLDDIEKATKNLQLIYRTVNDSSQPSESKQHKRQRRELELVFIRD